MCARSFGGRDEVRGVRGRNAADAGSNRHRNGVWYRASHVQVFGLPTDRAAVDVQSRQNVRHSFAGRRDPAESAHHRGADRQRRPSKRLGASDREAQQHTEGAEGTNGSGNEFAASVRGQGACEQAHRPSRETSVEEDFDFGLGHRDRQAPQQTNRPRARGKSQNHNQSRDHRQGHAVRPHLGRSAPRYPGGRGTTAASIFGAAQAAAALSGPRLRPPYALRLSGTLPPLSASFVITCLCSQTFISAEPSRAPV